VVWPLRKKIIRTLTETSGIFCFVHR